MTKAIIFDFWGVIGGDLYWNWLKNNVPGFESDTRAQKYFTELSSKVDRAEITAEEFYNQIKIKTGKLDVDILAEWKEQFELNSGLLDFIAKLKAKYKTAILSNSSDLIDFIIKENDLGKYFDKIFISYKIKMVKPQPEIFQYAVNELGVALDEAVFIDDNPLNVKAAEALGMTGFVYTSNKEIFEKLNKHL